MSNSRAISMLTKDNADYDSEKSLEMPHCLPGSGILEPAVLCVVFPQKIGTKVRFDARNVPRAEEHASPVSVACGLEMPLLEILRWLLYF